MRHRSLAIVFTFSVSVFSCALERQASSDYHARRQALARALSGGVAILFAPRESTGPNDLYGYRPDENFYYLTGWAEPGAALLIAPAQDAQDGSPAQSYAEILFLPARNYTEERWTGPKLGPDDPKAAETAGVDRVEGLDQMRDELAKRLPNLNAKILTDIPLNDEISNSERPLSWLKGANAFPVGTSYADIRPLLSRLRTVKDAGEIELIRKAVNASIAAQLSAIRAIRAGITERELAALLGYEWGRRGCERPAYAPIVGSGFRSTILHYSSDSATVHAGDLVLIDAAGEYSLYASDITRTLPADGKFSSRQREIYNIVLGAQEAAIAAFQSGKSHLLRHQPDSLYDVAFAYINTHGKDSHGEGLGKYFIHGLGHYVGLNVHDPGDYSLPLAPGMVFTIEPGIYIPEESFGVRIEDMFLVERGGKLVRLTQTLPQSAEEIEKLMAH
ncbi:MAG: aminopeptidase P N-terminal domain-containing protein [Acidobacteria bacterium]|nr:aminopeptidase P N-terminal domain-containing protein [Acidobacteriota bacterium]